MINELIREYLEYNQYYNTASVLITETGQPQEAPFDRNYMERRMQIGGGQQAGARQVPLLYGKYFELKPSIISLFILYRIGKWPSEDRSNRPKPNVKSKIEKSGK